MYDSDLDFSGLIYLDNAATSFPKPEGVIQAAADFYSKFGVNPGRSSFDMAKLASQMVDDTRKALTSLFGGSDYERLIFCSNATEALNIAIRGIVKDGDHVITTLLEHNSVLRPLNHLIEEKHITVDFLPPGQRGQVSLQELKSLIRPETRLVVINHASNVIGAVQPIAEIGKICRDNDTLLLVDAAQTAGHLDIDVNEMGISLLAFTGHKALMGPTGTGGLYINTDLPLAPLKSGGTGYNSITPLQPDDYPYHLEAGTLNLLGIAGLYFALQHINAVELQQEHKRLMSLFNKLESALMEMDRVTLYGPKQSTERVPVLNFNMKRMDAGTLATILDVDYNIATRKGLHCAPLLHQHLGTPEYGSVRISLGRFNTETEIAQTIQALEEINSGKAGY